ncbi:MAG: ATP-binding protein [Akkermansia sp.]|nr:ATP-binding protein [Akkermansia sp.]
MLVAIHIKNYKAIVDTTIDMRYGEGKAPNGYQELPRLPFLQDTTVRNPERPAQPLRVAPVLAIYGQNAAGKSTLMEAVRQISAFAYSSGIWTSKLEYKPNKLHPELHTTLFDVQFIVRHALYRFEVEYNADGIRREVLYKNGTPLYLVNHEQGEFRFTAIATADYPEKRLKAVLDTECSTEGKQQILLLSKLTRAYMGLNNDVVICHFYLCYDLQIWLDNDIRTSHALNMLSENFKENPVEQAFAEIEGLLTQLDLGIYKMDMAREIEDIEPVRCLEEQFQKEEEAASVFYRKNQKIFEYIYTYHKRTDGTEERFNLREESRGTQVLFGLLGVLLEALPRGATVVIVELDRSIHPIVLKALVRLFTDKAYNPNNAQLVFTVHNTELLDDDDLRVSEVGVVRKNLEQGAQLCRLCDFQGVRNVKNFRLGYLNGYFAGIPFPAL